MLQMSGLPSRDRLASGGGHRGHWRADMSKRTKDSGLEGPRTDTL